VHAPLVIDLAEPRLIERTMALSSSSWMLGFIVGPAAGGLLLKTAPSVLWIGAGALLLGAAAALLALERHVPERARRTPRQARVAAELAASEPLGG
jgi:predicted MFS family arabinose efflux permease